MGPPASGGKQSAARRFASWYFGSLCPELHLHRGALEKCEHQLSSSSALHESTEASAGKAHHRSLLMRFLITEKWTDGSLIALKTDVFAGVTLAVAQVAPSIAFALMGHAEPLVGLFSSFFLGVVCCIFGGRPGQITAIAGAVVVLYPDLVDKHGYGAACAVSVIAGGFLLLPGIFRFARLVRLLPSSLMIGFCNGLALSMVKNQISQFKGPDGNYVTGTQALFTAIICVITYAVMMVLPYFTNVIPSAFVALVVGTAIEYIFHLDTVTIGDLYELHGTFPAPTVPKVNWSDSSAIKDVMVASVLTAIISAVESFMSGYKMQQLTETPTNFERESLALGAAHILNGFFQGMAGCVVFGPCILNIECGAGARRLSSFICAVLMLVIPLALYVVIRIIPMGALSAVLFGVSSKTADWRMLAMIFLQRISFQESVVAILVTVVTVISDLAIGAASGLAAALVFFMWNMSRGRITLAPAASLQAAPPAPLPPAQDTSSGLPHFIGGAHHDDEESTSAAEVVVPCCDAEVIAAEPFDRDQGGGNSGTSNADAAAPDDVELCFRSQNSSIAAVRREAQPEDGTTVIVALESSSPIVNRSFIGNPHTVDVNFLDVQQDATFSDVKVLRIKLSGVLFFGSCMEFVDGMIEMLHMHHSEIFLQVTDFILDFQHGRMPVVDFSAAEAIQDTAHLLAKRGIRTHVQNMDPLSWACFDRVRRYFPDVCESDVNNVKHICYVRRIFHIASTHTMVQAGFNGDAVDDDDVFLRGNRSFVRTTADADAEELENRGPPPRPPHTVDGGCVVETECNTRNRNEDESRHVTVESERKGSKKDVENCFSTFTASVVQDGQLSATEECVSFAESVKIGLPVYLSTFDITVPVFDTIANWTRRTQDAIDRGLPVSLEAGLTSAKPFNRQFGDIGALWWKRLWNTDIPDAVWSNLGSSPPSGTSAPRRPINLPLQRDSPAVFQQVPRFPGQGYAKGEELLRREWVAVKASVYQQLFHTSTPKEPGRICARVTKFKDDLLNGFI